MAIKHGAILGRSDIYNVDPKQIKVQDGWNPRTDFSDEEELMKSIIENGVTKVLEVRKIGEDIVLVAGERRLRATLRAIKEGYNIVSIPCKFTRKDISDSEAFILTMIENEGKRLNPIEEAEGFQRLRNWGFPVSAIAKRFGKNPVSIYRRLLLIDASEELKQEIKEKKINITEAEKIIKESSGSIDVQNKKTKAVRKSMRMPDIKNLLKEKEAKKDSLFESQEERAFNDGAIWALKKVMGD
ncbi:MAG: ParB N-terminal domain-containing protein [Gammaproteobacteria bacterium]|nr:ParB N-terminal domain-containing protein [Gammaproteobacteria bacterium]